MRDENEHRFPQIYFFGSFVFWTKRRKRAHRRDRRDGVSCEILFKMNLKLKSHCDFLTYKQKIDGDWVFDTLNMPLSIADIHRRSLRQCAIHFGTITTYDRKIHYSIVYAHLHNNIFQQPWLKCEKMAENWGILVIIIEET